MNWFSTLRKKIAPSSKEKVRERIDIPLFPLGSVLFPGGILSLKVFEQRYLDMVAGCLRQKAPFGICLIAKGKETGEPAIPHSIGTLAHIVEADVPQLGFLTLKVRGGSRFRILSSNVRSDGVRYASVELLEEATGQDVPAAQSGLLQLLQQVVSDLGVERIPEPHAFNDAAWVGYRLTEILPVQVLAKQKLLELDDPLSRLEIIHSYLAQRQLVK